MTMQLWTNQRILETLTLLVARDAAAGRAVPVMRLALARVEAKVGQ
jgi:hypothetical protein